MSGNAFAAPGKAEAFGGGSFDRDPAGIGPKQSGKTLPHGLGVWGDFGALADQGDVGIGQDAVSGGDAIRRVGQESGAIGVLPGGFRRREMAADITLGEGAVNRVAQGMDAHIGIGVAGEPLIMGDLDATEKQGPACFQRVHVETDAGAGDEASGEDAFEAHQILRIGEFDVVFRARDNGDLFADGFEQGGIIGCRGDAGAMGAEQDREAEGLGGLGSIEPLARHRFDDTAFRSAFEGVGDRGARDRSGDRLQCGE